MEFKEGDLVYRPPFIKGWTSLRRVTGRYNSEEVFVRTIVGPPGSDPLTITYIHYAENLAHVTPEIFLEFVSQFERK